MLLAPLIVLQLFYVTRDFKSMRNYFCLIDQKTFYANNFFPSFSTESKTVKLIKQVVNVLCSNFCHF